MSLNDPKPSEVSNVIVSEVKVEQAGISSRFNLPAFSFLACFGLLMSHWWAEIDGPGSLLLTVGLSALLSLFGWIFVALLVRFAITLPITTISHSDPVAGSCYAITFALLLHYWISPGDEVLSILLTMAVSAVVAIPFCLVLLFPARILVKFLTDLFGKK